MPDFSDVSSATDLNLPVPPPPRMGLVAPPLLVGSDSEVASGTVREPDNALVIHPLTGAVEVEPPLPRIPGFQLEQVLGRGAMGVVYLARQEGLNRTVALKMILAGDHASAQVRQRFLGEAAAVAKVRHPGIVQVYEFGIHQHCPYFALEYVPGGSLDRVLAAGPLPPAAAARLVAALADAMQAAHDAGVVHRDLKPANVLLALSRAPEARAPGSTACSDDSSTRATSTRLNEAQPKITDFGLAKQLDTAAGLTASGAVMGTPSYMAPEQAAARHDLVGPVTDVYALGAILYECLTGRPPFKGAAMMDTLEQVLLQEPVAVRQLQPKVPRDLETICHKCLRKEPARRYASAQALADDLRHHLEGRPIQARPVGRPERAWKWCRRYPAVATLLMVALLAAGSMAVLATWALGEKQRAKLAEAEQRQAQELAQQRLRQVTQGVEILAAVFQALDPKAEQTEGVSLRRLLGKRLHQAAAQLDGAAVGDAVVVARLQNVLGRSLFGLGQYAQAVTILERAVATQEKLLGPDHPETLQSRNNLAACYHVAGQWQRALPLLEQTLPRLEAVLGPDHTDTLSAMNNLADLYRSVGRTEQALKLFRTTLARRQGSLGPSHPLTLLSRLNLATWQRDAGLFAQALPLLEETLGEYRQVLGPDHPESLKAMTELAQGYCDAGQLARALPLLTDALRRQKEALGPDHPDTLMTMCNLAEAYRAAGQPGQAVTLQAETLQRREATLGKDHSATLVSRNNLAASYRDAGQPAKALPLFEEVYRHRLANDGPDQTEIYTSMGNLATVYWETGQPDKALPLMEDAVKGRKAKLGPDHPATLGSMNNLAEMYRSSGQLAKALPLREETLRLQKAKLGLDHPETLIGMNNLAYAYQVAGQVDRAIPVYEEALRRITVKLGAEHPHTLFIRANLAVAWLAAKQPDRAAPLLKGLTGKTSIRAAMPMPWANKLEEASKAWLSLDPAAAVEPLLREALELRTKHLPANHWQIAAPQSLLGAALTTAQQFDEAERLLLAAHKTLAAARARGPLPPAAQPLLRETVQRLVKLYEANGNSAAVAQWRTELEALKPTPSAGK